MLFRIDVSSRTTLYDQLAGQVRGALLRGEIASGDRLPSAHELAQSLGINIHTVLRAYGVLRDEGLIELRRGRGAIVVGEPVQGDVVTAVHRLLEAAQRNGLSLAQVHHAIDEGAT